MLATACSNAPDEQRLRRAEAAAHRHRSDVDAVSLRASRLSREWADIEQEFQRAAHDHELAQAQLQTAIQGSARASEQFAKASETATRAATKWRIFQQLVMIAAAVDAANLDAARAAGARGTVSVDCGENMSTAAFRALLASHGADLTGKDIDHIVPRSLGGADNPGNYQVLPSSENRSLGATWNQDKCLAVGEVRCARAIATSHRCGSLRGMGF